jgi:hypothetical protein
MPPTSRQKKGGGWRSEGNDTVAIFWISTILLGHRQQLFLIPKFQGISQAMTHAVRSHLGKIGA